MRWTEMYIAISILTLAVIAVLLFLVGRRRRAGRLTPLGSLSFGFVLAGIIFGETRALGYGLLGVGVILAIADIINRSKTKQIGE